MNTEVEYNRSKEIKKQKVKRENLVKTQCPKCNAQYNVPESHEGKKTKCLKCNESFVIVEKTIADDKWVLNPNSTFPLTILGVDKNTALKLKNILDQTKTVHVNGLFNSVAEIVAQSGLRCKEIEDYIAKYREQFDSVGEGQPIDEHLDVIPYCNLDSLFNGDQIDKNRAVSELITLTYAHSYFATQRILNNTNPAIAEILKGYEITTVGDDCTCPFCARMDGKKYPAESPPKTPFHIGCRCTLLTIFD